MKIKSGGTVVQTIEIYLEEGHVYKIQIMMSPQSLYKYEVAIHSIEKMPKFHFLDTTEDLAIVLEEYGVIIDED